MDRKDFMKFLALGSVAGFSKPQLADASAVETQESISLSSLGDNSPASERAKEVLEKLTFDEKLMISGGEHSFYFPGIKRLDLRPVRMSDASQGVHLRNDFKGKKSTSFPPMLALASTWNPELAQTYGKYVGEECRALGIDILLGPGINMYRHSQGGRNYEYMGEEPLVTSKIVSDYVKGLQSNKVIATAKHFVANDQEVCRQICSSDVGERALREIYLPPWKAVIQQGGTKGIMTGNNSVNGVPCSMNKRLVNDLLREEYGFTGIAMTDWQNTSYFPEKQDLVLDSGESLLMPRNDTFSNYIESYIDKHPDKSAEIESKLNQMIYPNLLTLFEMEVYDRKGDTDSFDKKFKEYKAKHQELAKKCGEEAICLLKNEDDILPLEEEQQILMVGSEEPFTGGGSGYVAGYEHVDYPTAFSNKYGDNFECKENASDSEIRNADLVLFRLNKEASEAKDVAFEEPVEQQKELLRCAELNSNMVVVITAGNGLAMPWLDKVKGVVWTNILGQERGNALVNILSGDVNPSGHLPFTIEKKFEDSPDPDYNLFGGEPYWKGKNEFKEYFLGEDPDSDTPMARYIQPHQLVHIRYSEGIFMGYRWYDHKNIDPQFPFGFGLSYTTFNFKNPVLDSKTLNAGNTLKLSFDLKNSGQHDGAQVAQLYVKALDSKIMRPVKELKGFEKVLLKSGSQKKVNFTVAHDDLAYWDTSNHDWQVEPGDYELLIGSSSRDIHLRSRIKVS